MEMTHCPGLSHRESTGPSMSRVAECGKAMPSINALMQIARALGVDKLVCASAKRPAITFSNSR